MQSSSVQLETNKVIEISNLSVSFNGTPVLNKIDLTVYERDFIGIIGPNGGGKSTLLRTILGLIEPDQGKISIMGLPHKQARHLISYVPQYAVFDRDFPISVWEVVLMGRIGQKSGRRYSREDKEIALEALQRVEMDTLKNRQIGQLSGGERQRVLVARALAAKPQILLLDEPTASVDSRFEAGFYDILQELNQEITIILVSHDISALSAYVKTIACLNQQLFYQHAKELNEEMIEHAYNCPVHLIAHGVPHRVLAPHDGVVG
ncbi:MAG TPA: ABC transporter ATP-binding protein [Syntrophomonadaceae bacterium]|jgi:zinc transport system ATP-binding protein|nr:ABC transporter ATP-binding protein [Syntrophomonadaceae bacterium]